MIAFWGSQVIAQALGTSIQEFMGENLFFILLKFYFDFVLLLLTHNRPLHCRQNLNVLSA